MNSTWYNVGMKQTIALKLEPTPEQFDALLQTVEAFNAGCNYVAEVAFQERSASKVGLQPLVYSELRARFGLSSQMAIRAISKACEAYKRDRNIQPVFDPHGAMVYDERVMNIKDAAHVSLLTLQGRILVPMRYGFYQAARLSMQKGQADLILRNGTFYLYLCIDLPTPPPIETVGFLGIDLGIVEIASDSAGNQYSGEAVKKVRKNVREHRRQLQRKRTNSAKKRLRRIASRQSRFVRDVNHQISKKLVATALRLKKALALEDLRGIRERASTVSKQMRWLLGNWAFDQLKQFVSYKAEASGLCVVLVDPRNTSRTCPNPECGFCDKANRKSQSCFQCLKCGYTNNADLVGALNVEARAEMSSGLLSSAVSTG